MMARTASSTKREGRDMKASALDLRRIARAALLALAACAGDAREPEDASESDAPDATPSERCPALDVIRSGHRGSGRKAASNRWPENTLPSFIAAAEAGADSVEIDVTYTADGVLVGLHDDTVDRTTDGTGCAGALTLDEITRLDAAVGTDLAGTGVTIPTLEQALAALDIDVNIEIKLPESPCPQVDPERLADDVAAAIAADSKPREVIASSFSAETLSLLVPNGIYLVLHRRDPVLAAGLGLAAVNVAPREDIADSIAVAHEHGLETLTVTADRDRIRDALEGGVDTILTDDLELMAEQQHAVCDAWAAALER
jgi:glycerophosphoryl diester phosphodiesterase